MLENQVVIEEPRNKVGQISRKKGGRIAGFWYLFSGMGQLFNFSYVLPKLVAAGSASATASNIQGNEWLFRLGFIGELLSAVALLLCVRAVYRLLHQVNRGYATLMVSLVIAALPISFVNVLNEIGADVLLNGSSYLAAFSKNQLDALAMVFLNIHSYGLSVVNILWALWLAPFGIIAYRSGFLPRILGVLLIVACCGYLTDSLFILLSLPFQSVVNVVGLDLMGSLGEGSMMAYLIIRGSKGASLPISSFFP